MQPPHPSNPKQLNSLRLSAQKVITVLTERAQLKPVLGSHFPSISELTDHEQKARLSMGKTGNSEKRECDHRRRFLQNRFELGVINLVSSLSLSRIH
ncbi:hypothetical protein TNCT_415451 [Trichonephila clavata]|uniref:Uncharacterized protein n=1 Tax=Trichonephila clavata TaxID=2740835 RepID=A0A8X6K0Q7_TRICU|nr:hypothetical protein TNCT_415451 [Trichonephila clavata]